MGRRVLTWQADGGRPRWEQAHVVEELGGWRARGVVVVGGAEPYRLDYELDTGAELATRRLVVRAEGPDWRRELWLRRDADGAWSVRRLADLPNGRPDFAAGPGALAGALDCDLGESPLTNSMPVLRHGLHQAPGHAELLMAWVSVPDLVVHPSEQVYEHARTTAGGGVTAYRSERFTTEIEFDADGFVISYPGIGHRV